METRSSHAAPGIARRSVADLPGPRQLPLIGNLHQVDRQRLHLAMEAWAEQYGPLFRFSLGRRQVVGVADPMVIGGILRDRPEGFRRSTLLETTFRELGIGGVFASNGDSWRRQRKMVAAAFDTRHVKNYFPFLLRVTERFYRRWFRHADTGSVFDLQADLMRYTVDVVAGLAFGVDINTIESDRESIQTHLNHIFPMLMRRLSTPFPYWRWLRLPQDRALDRSLVVVHRAVEELIAKARARLLCDPALRDAPSNLLDAMLAARDSADSGLTDYDVASNVVTMLLGGEDTTAHTLAWLMHLVSGDAAVRRRLAEEADTVLGDEHFPQRLELASSLTFTAACVHETMRLKPIAPILILETCRPTLVGDVALPRGAVAACLIRKGSMDGGYFPRPTAFEPERWLRRADERAEGTAARERISMPFGAGPRICPGRNLALLEMAMVTSMLFRNFEIAELEPADGRPVRECLNFAMGPSKLLVRLAHR